MWVRYVNLLRLSIDAAIFDSQQLLFVDFILKPLPFNLFLPENLYDSHLLHPRDKCILSYQALVFVMLCYVWYLPPPGRSISLVWHFIQVLSSHLIIPSWTQANTESIVSSRLSSCKQSLMQAKYSCQLCSYPW